jgi:hypothetical protein
MTAVTGTWNLEAAIVSCWEEQGLDAAFKAYWSEANKAKFLTLSDTEARSGTPWPYCVFKAERPNALGHSSGTSGNTTERRYINVPVQLDIRAKGISGGSDGKTIAVTLAKLVAAAYDRKANWSVEQDYIQQVRRVTDYSTREDDEVWLYTLLYEVRLDQVFDR